MSDTTTTASAAAPRRSAAQWTIVAVLVILGILALIAAILFITGTANSIHFLSGSVHHGHHGIRLTVSLVAAVLLLGAAGYFMKTTSKSLVRDSGRRPASAAVPPVNFSTALAVDVPCGRAHISITRPELTAKPLAQPRENGDDACAFRMATAVGG